MTAIRQPRSNSVRATRRKLLARAALVLALLGLASGASLAGAGTVNDAPAAVAAIPGTIDEFSIPTGAAAYPTGITTGPDGNLWFTEEVANQVGRIGPSGGLVDEFSLLSDANVGYITAGPDRNLWLTEFESGQIGRMSLTGAVKEFAVPSGGPNLITAGPDGNLWFTEFGPGKIGRITPAGVVTEFVVPSTPYPGAITAGPDGNLWFTEPFANKIGRITTAGAITEFSVPTANQRPSGIAAGPDGNLWFGETSGIGRITPAGAITEFPAAGEPGAIVAGSDGNLWFTETASNKIGQMTPAGVVVNEFPVPTPDSYLIDLTAGPDGNLWFTEADAGQVARLSVAAAGTRYVLSNASGFAPSTRAAPQGATVKWSFYGPKAQRVVDRSGMGLFGSGALPPVSYYSFVFRSAGTYLYYDPLNSGHTGSIVVPLKVSPATGTPTTSFTITWSRQTAPAGYVFDVQIVRPGQATWFEGWMTGQTVPSASFVPDAGAGSYYFRSRMRKTANGKFSNWSPPALIRVS